MPFCIIRGNFIIMRRMLVFLGCWARWNASANNRQILSSAFLQGADADDLGRVYESESKLLEPWTDSPGEISTDDWRDYLGCREYASLFRIGGLFANDEQDIKEHLLITLKMSSFDIAMIGRKWSTSIFSRDQSRCLILSLLTVCSPNPS